MTTDIVIFLSFTVPACIILLIAVIKDDKEY